MGGCSYNQTAECSLDSKSKTQQARLKHRKDINPGSKNQSFYNKNSTLSISAQTNNQDDKYWDTNQWTSPTDQVFEVCRGEDRPDPRFWDQQFQIWIESGKDIDRPDKHPWPEHPWNTHPEMYDIAAHAKYQQNQQPDCYK